MLKELVFMQIWAYKSVKWSAWRVVIVMDMLVQMIVWEDLDALYGMVCWMIWESTFKMDKIFT